MGFLGGPACTKFQISHVIVFQVIQLQLFILATFQQNFLNISEDDEISVDDSSDEAFGEFMGIIVIVKKENVNKDAPLTAIKQRDRQPLLKKSPTDKVFDFLSSNVGGKSESTTDLQ